MEAVKGDTRAWVNILFALPDEANPLIKRLSKNELENERIAVGKDRLLYVSTAARLSIFCSGMGGAAASATAKYIITKPEARRSPLIICGFGGGLDADAPPGSLVLVESVESRTGDRFHNMEADPRLLAALGTVVVPDVSVRHGRLITMDRVLTQAAEKQALGSQTGACAVDMETAFAAQIAQQYGVPWIGVRAITDGSDDDLPFDFNTMADANGTVNKGRVALSALTHPWKIPALIRLGARSALAAKNLTAFLEASLKILVSAMVSVLLCLLSLSVAAEAQTSPLTPESSIALALRNSPQARAAKFAREAARLEAGRNSILARPTVTARAEGGEQGPHVVFPRPDSTEATFLPEHVQRLDLVLEQQIYHAGSGAERRRHSAQNGIADQDYRKALSDLAWSVRKAYVDVLRAEAGVSAAQDGLDAAVRYQELVQRQITAGVAKPVDAETVKAQVAEAQAGLEKSRGGLLSARAAFNRLVGLPLDTVRPLQPLGPLPTAPESPSEAIAAALHNRPELISLAQTLNVAKAETSLARVQSQPTLSVRGQLTEQTPTALVHEHYVAAFLEIRWSLIDGGKSRLDTKEASAQAKRTEALLDDAGDGIALEVTQAWQKMRDASGQIALMQAQVKGTEATARVAEKAYEVGQGTAVAVQAAQREVRSARRREVDATYDLYSAEIDFTHAQSADLPQPELTSGKKSNRK